MLNNKGDKMSWIFKQKRPGDTKARNPVSDEFFTDPELLTDASSLVREAIQNSLDATADISAPVKIRFKVGVRDNVHASPNYFSGLEKHTLKTLGSELGRIDESCRYLIYEDFNTTGLWGDSNIDFVEESANKELHSYTYFVHYEGEGSKSDGKKGKWGIGKIVFPMLSGIKTFFAYSIRPVEMAPCGKTNLLIGQSIQRFHELEGVPYYPDGWFVENADGVPIPHSGAEAANFAANWGMARNLGETGLSILVPYIRADLGIPQFRDAVIRQYFLAILAGELECIFEDENGIVLELNGQNISQVIEAISTLTEGSSRDLNTYQVKTAIAGFSAARDDLEAVAIDLPETSVSPLSLDVSPVVIDSAKSSLERHGLALFEVGIRVPQAESSRLVGDTFEVLVVQADGDNAIIYSREGILVPGTRAVKVKNYLALVMMDEGPLANLLGLAEGPAHEDWRDDTKKFKAGFGNSGAKRTQASWTLKAVRNFPKRLVELISKSESQVLDDEFFADLFVVPDSPSDNNPRKLVRPLPTPPEKTSPKQIPNFSVQNGKLSISNGSSGLPAKSRIRVEVAYAVAKGNPFSKWDKLDFSLSDRKRFKIRKSGADIRELGDNSFEFVIQNSSSWLIEIPGFEAYRDLEVKSEVLSAGRETD